MSQSQRERVTTAASVMESLKLVSGLQHKPNTSHKAAPLLHFKSRYCSAQTKVTVAMELAGSFALA